MEIAVSEPETEWDLVSNKGKYTSYLITVSVLFIYLFIFHFIKKKSKNPNFEPFINTKK